MPVSGMPNENGEPSVPSPSSQQNGSTADEEPCQLDSDCCEVSAEELAAILVESPTVSIAGQDDRTDDDQYVGMMESSIMNSRKDDGDVQFLPDEIVYNRSTSEPSTCQVSREKGQGVMKEDLLSPEILSNDPCTPNTTPVGSPQVTVEDLRRQQRHGLQRVRVGNGSLLLSDSTSDAGVRRAKTDKLVYIKNEEEQGKQAEEQSMKDVVAATEEADVQTAVQQETNMLLTQHNKLLESTRKMQQECKQRLSKLKQGVLHSSSNSSNTISNFNSNSNDINATTTTTATTSTTVSTTANSNSTNSQPISRTNSVNTSLAHATQPTPGVHTLRFAEQPSHVLVLKKPNQPQVTQEMLELVQFLGGEGYVVHVEEKVYDEETQLHAWSFVKVIDVDSPGKGVDFSITLGGDGTVLHYNSLFHTQKGVVPPVVSFAMGSLGFLTPFPWSKYRPVLQTIRQAHKKPIFVCSRSRLLCKVLSRDKDGAVAVSQPLNELVIQRRDSSMALLQLFVDGEFVSTIRADGVIISTPTGSTAYGMSAGGPMVTPSTQALIITPLCPHNLNFRPIVVCDKTVLRLTVDSAMSPNTPLIATFDGRGHTELFPGDSIQVITSHIRVPSIVFSEFNIEWFKSIKEKLNWNVSV